MSVGGAVQGLQAQRLGAGALPREKRGLLQSVGLYFAKSENDILQLRRTKGK